MSGPDSQELKQVRQALKKCLRYARIITLEKEYLDFVKPDMKLVSEQRDSDKSAEERKTGSLPEFEFVGEVRDKHTSVQVDSVVTVETDRTL